MCFFFINNHLNKIKLKYKIIINFKKQKKPFLIILNELLDLFYKFTKISKQNNYKNKIIFKHFIPLPHHLKYIYFKKKIVY